MHLTSPPPRQEVEPYRLDSLVGTMTDLLDQLGDEQVCVWWWWWVGGWGRGGGARAGRRRCSGLHRPSQRGNAACGPRKRVSCLLSASCPPQAAVVGHDWGAALAWHMAMTAPSRVSKLVPLSVGCLGEPSMLFCMHVLHACNNPSLRRCRLVELAKRCCCWSF